MDNENVNEKRSIRIGRNTFGITLIAFGILAILQMFVKFEVLRYALMLWPIIFILLGIEVIYYNNKKDVNIKYDVAGIILMFLILGFGVLMSFGNFAVNKVLYNADIKEAIIEESVERKLNLSFEDKVNIFNYSDMQVNVKVIEIPEFTDTIVNVSANYNEEKIDNIITAIGNRYDISNYVYASYQDDSVVISEDSKYVKDINITIKTNNKDNITYKGNINLI